MTTPHELARTVPAADLPALDFDLASRGWRITERTDLPDGMVRIEAVKCECPVCRETPEPTPAKTPRRKRPDPDRILSQAEGAEFFRQLKQQLIKP